VVVFVGFQTLVCLFSVEALLFKALEHFSVDRDCMVAYDDALHGDFFTQGVPHVSADVFHRLAPGGVGIQHVFEQIFALRGGPFGTGLLACEDLLLEGRRVGVFEGEVSTNHREQDDSAGPDVHLDAVLLLPCHHFRSGITRTPAGCFEHLPFFVGVAQPEIDNFDILLGV